MAESDLKTSEILIAFFITLGKSYLLNPTDKKQIDISRFTDIINAMKNYISKSEYQNDSHKKQQFTKSNKTPDHKECIEYQEENSSDNVEDEQEKTLEETIDYVKCMTLTQNVNPEVYNYLTNSNINEVNKYIALPMTATRFFEEKKTQGSREQITAELIYYWMIALNIPFECQKWHLNKLFTLIRVCDVKSRPPKKHSRREIMKRNAALNAARRKKWNTKG